MNINNKRIAQNTLMLYFRMILTMGVSLYTSRVVLEVLGVEDFGIYSVVGSVVVMFGFLNYAMSTATQRFFSFELGRKNIDQLKKVFSLSVSIHAIIAIFIFLLAETIGLWFLNARLAIPLERMETANWVYQFSVFTFMVNVMAVPYNAAIISHERMNIYAYVSILEVILRLAIVFLLQCFEFDKLQLYAIFVFIVSLIIRVVYQLIMDYRYHNQVKVEYDIDESILDKKIPKNILQPLVENAYYHGLSADTGEIQGNIEILIYPLEDELIIEISDDGKGFSEKRLMEIRENLKHATMHKEKEAHIGMENIYRRISYLYGDNFSMDIQSEEGHGSTIVLTFPLETEDSRN